MAAGPACPPTKSRATSTPPGIKACTSDDTSPWRSTRITSAKGCRAWAGMGAVRAVARGAPAKAKLAAENATRAGVYPHQHLALPGDRIRHLRDGHFIWRAKLVDGYCSHISPHVMRKALKCRYTSL